MVEICFLTEDDRTEWEALTRRFNEHFGAAINDGLYERTWQRLVSRDEIRGIAARLDGRIVGLAHYYFHTGIWHAGRCYLADLFVAREARRRGVATTILKWVAQDAAEHGFPRLYWNAGFGDTAARALYDTVADYKGFIVYSYRRRPNPRPTAARPGAEPR